jgi:ABC-2 type transport system ATP-binding protein
VQLGGNLDALLEEHRWVTGPPDALVRLAARTLVGGPSAVHGTGRVLARSQAPLIDPALSCTRVKLDELVLAYLEIGHARESIQLVEV